MRIKFIFSTAPLILGVLLFIYTIFKIGITQIIETISMITFAQFVLLLLVNSIGTFISAIRWKLILQSLDAPISIYQISMAKLVGLAISYVTPGVFMGSMPFRAYFLKEEAGIPLKKSAASVIIDEAVFLVIAIIFIIVGLFFLIHWALLSKKISIIIGFAVGIFLVIFYSFYTRTVNKKSGEKGFFSYIIDVLRLSKIAAIARVKDKIIEIENLLSVFFKAHKYTLITAVVLTIIENIFYLITFWLTIYYLGHKINIQTMISIMSAIYSNYLIPIPAAIGSLELSQSYIFDIFGMGENTGLGFTLITRTISLFFVAIGLIILGYYEIKILWQKQTRELPSQKE